MNPAHAIGVFDSGLGGLTVVQALDQELPVERIVYLGDTARVPYGSKSPDTVARYSLMSARFLLRHEVKLLLIACNTASAFALDALARELPVPVLGAVGPGAAEAVAATRSGRIGVIGTLGTIRSASYARAIAALAPSVSVAQLACPLLVPLVEEGWLGDGQGHGDEQRATETVARRYLMQLHAGAPDLDVLVLGCTHYPLLRPLLERIVGELWPHPVRLVDSARAMARAAREALTSSHLLGDGPGALRCFLTDDARFELVGSRFLGRPLERAERVDL